MVVQDFGFFEVLVFLWEKIINIFPICSMVFIEVLFVNKCEISYCEHVGVSIGC